MEYLPLFLSFITLVALIVGTMGRRAVIFKVSQFHKSEFKNLSIISLHIALMIVAISIISETTMSGKILGTIIGIYGLIAILRK